ncbi:PREDICTED: cilia- and flagella-associated protein 69-like [Trachymyrmex septentrionalis]|uniref:cilia- and flagella-associated protein 69-like n=1 Tax=Trachymyrmex septentrionalis TaxID=34720 RepID=UPI00084F5EF2|nr:PREDICTED: cilia- and flagella-associated protein 69-like [Trachymyrmex septentrionalis]
MERKRQDHCFAPKKSIYPKYVNRNNPPLYLNNAEKYRRRIDVDYTVEKLRQLVSDPVTNDHVERISRLLSDYLREIGDDGYPVRHLPVIMKILEFLAWKSRETNDYQEHLDRMLQLCSQPPLLKQASESLTSSVIIEHYFTFLGYLLIILPNEEDVQRIHEALDCLLIRQTKPINIAAVKLDFCRRAMENSRLPIIIIELLEAAMPKIYPKILELAYTVASISNQCCHRMLQAGILNTLLTRMDLPCATELSCAAPLDIPLMGEEYPRDIMLLKMKLLWSLMRSVLSSKTLPEHLKDLPSLKQCAMWGLRYSFKRQILRGQYCAVSLRIRNDIAALILAGIVALPSWNLVSSGIAEDIVHLLPSIESGTTTIWAESVKFSNSKEDFFFKKILLMIIAYLADIEVYVFVMDKAMIMSIILRIIKFCMNEKDKGSFASLILLERAMHILSLLAPRIETKFVKRKGTLILLIMLKQILNVEFDEYLTMIFTRSVCSIILQDSALLLEDFQKHGMIPLLIKLFSNIMSLAKFTMKGQRILTLLLISLEGLMKKQMSVQQMCERRSVELILEIFAKCLHQRNEDFQVDQRLLLAIGSFVWKCIVRSPENLQIFLNGGGLYSMLDTIEIASYPVRCLYLGALTDICDTTFCGPCLCTWRGADKKTGLISLFMNIWREEEDRIGMKRHADGSIDPEDLQMGTEQWIDTYRFLLTEDVSPTITDMIDSVRSKIFSILKIIERDGVKYEMARQHYKILLEELPTKDCVTLCYAEMYLKLKLGQMWTELSRNLEQTGVNPLSVDKHLIVHMVHWHHSWRIAIEDHQRKLIAMAKKADESLEKDKLKRIRDSKLASTLEALDDVDRMRRTTDRSYMLRKKDRQRQQVRATLSFPRDADVKQCHRTFSDKTNVTAIFGQHHLIDIPYLKDFRSDFSKISLISSASLPDSPSKEVLSSLEVSQEFLLL